MIKSTKADDIEIVRVIGQPKSKPAAGLRKNPSFFQRRIKPKHHVRRLEPYYPRRGIIQMYRHKTGLGVLCIRDESFCLTNGATSYVFENEPCMDRIIMEKIYEMNVSFLYVTDAATRVHWDAITRKLNKNDPMVQMQVVTLTKTTGNCPTCHKNCVWWSAICGINCLKKVAVDPIPHN